MADGAISPEQAQYDANLQGWSGVKGARIRADQQHLDRIDEQAIERANSHQEAVGVMPIVATESNEEGAFESARALGVDTANRMDMQEADKSKLAVIREKFSNLLKPSQKEPQAV